MKKLTSQQSKFKNEFLIDMNATQASIRAGYSKKTANQIGPKLLTIPHIAEAIAKAQEKLSKKTEVTQISVIQDLEKIKNRCMQAESVLDKNGEATGEYKFDATSALKAIELQGKTIGAFVDVKEIRKSGQDFFAMVQGHVRDGMSKEAAIKKVRGGE
jgi:phage terminase small subunit